MAKEFTNQIENLLKAKIPAVYIENYEWERFQADIFKAVKNSEKGLFFFNDAKGLQEMNFKDKSLEDQEETDIVTIIDNLGDDSVYVFDNVHSYLRDAQIITRFRVAIRSLKAKSSHIIFFSPLLEIPKELEKDLTVVEYPLPSAQDISKRLEQLLTEFNAKKESQLSEAVIKSLLGLTMKEIENSASKTIIEYGKITEDEISSLINEKEQIIKKSGFLEYFHPRENMDSIGGLDNLKSWLNVRSKAFYNRAKEFGLNYPKGVMLLGIPGTGKSLSAKAVSNSWKMPLLRLDFGKIFGGIVGESESNIRQTIKIAESLAPCVLWIDEIEKGLGGASSSGGNDSGVSVRVFGTFLTWMQEKESEVFVLATANNISGLPPELLRKGRFDEIFFVDLPTKEEREEIIKIHLIQRKQKPENINITKIAEESSGFSGAELGEVIHESLFNIFDPNNESPPVLKTRDILDTLKTVFPLSKTMDEKIKSLRKWAKNRTKLASKYEPEEIQTNSKIPRLKQEILDNPFIEDEEE